MAYAKLLKYIKSQPIKFFPIKSFKPGERWIAIITPDPTKHVATSAFEPYIILTSNIKYLRLYFDNRRNSFYFRKNDMSITEACNFLPKAKYSNTKPDFFLAAYNNAYAYYLKHVKV